jgi:nucleotide-binding universal stress UspA family protein
MDLVAEHFQKLEIKIKQLAEDHQRIKTERDLLIKQSVIQQQTIEEQQTELENLKKQVQALKIAKSVESRQETGKVKEKIQDLVREIDRCIELLNN